MRGGMMNRRTRRFADSTRIIRGPDSAYEKYPAVLRIRVFLHTRQRRDDELLRSAERPYLEQSLDVIAAGGGVD